MSSNIKMGCIHVFMALNLVQYSNLYPFITLLKNPCFQVLNSKFEDQCTMILQFLIDHFLHITETL